MAVIFPLKRTDFLSTALQQVTLRLQVCLENLSSNFTPPVLFQCNHCSLQDSMFEYRAVIYHIQSAVWTSLSIKLKNQKINKPEMLCDLCALPYNEALNQSEIFTCFN